jgi:hypothetical protein
VALEEVAGSSPVGPPTQSRIGKPETRIKKADTVIAVVLASFWTSIPCPKASAALAPLDQVNGYGVAPPTLIAAGRLKRRST